MSEEPEVVEPVNEQENEEEEPHSPDAKQPRQMG